MVAGIAMLGGVAQADQLTVYSCHDPAGEAVGNAGWSILKSEQQAMSVVDSCAADGQGTMWLELGANGLRDRICRWYDATYVAAETGRAAALDEP